MPFLLLFELSISPAHIKTKAIIKLTTVLAFLGVGIVVITIFLNLTNLLPADLKSPLFVSGFALMLLGTLWKVVIEMNQEEE